MEAEHEIDFGKALYGAAGMMRVTQLRDVKASLEDLMTQRLEDFNAGRLRIGLSQANCSGDSDE
jgi:HPt (histidine-containing phosphotransfer) domain-containing protein